MPKCCDTNSKKIKKILFVTYRMKLMSDVP